MLQNKIYYNYFLEIFKTFLTIIIGLSLIAFTVRAVNFLELIVDNGYSLSTYFKYSILNIFGVAPKFFPLAFLISIIIFIIKHLNNNEFIILWSAGVKKLLIVNLLLFSSFIIMLIYLIFSVYLTPLALSKSRQMLGESSFNSLLPTIKSQQFSDSFKGLTLYVDKKVDNEIGNIFLHDTGKNLSNFSTNIEDANSTTIIAEKGIVEKKNLFLINGQIITYKKNKNTNEVFKFDQLNIDLSGLSTTVIKDFKLQETASYKLLSCFLIKKNNLQICNSESKKEIIPILIRRLILPSYMPIIALICSLLLFKNKSFFSRRVSVFTFCFSLLIFVELILKYTGTNNIIKYIYIMTPILVFIFLYPLLTYKFNKN